MQVGEKTKWWAYSFTVGAENLIFSEGLAVKQWRGFFLRMHNYNKVPRHNKSDLQNKPEREEETDEPDLQRSKIIWGAHAS